jgi:hypothetical protein
MGKISLKSIPSTCVNPVATKKPSDLPQNNQHTFDLENPLATY